jgi:hypothetical protein
MNLLLILVLLALGAYSIGVLIFLTNHWTTPAERIQKCKVIPAEIVLVTVPINIGLSMNPLSAYRLIVDEQIRGYLLMGLVLAAIFVYTVQLSLGKILHARNQGAAFCQTSSDRKKLLGLYFVAGIFIAFAFAIAKLYRRE